MRFEQDTACRGTHCASTPLPAQQQHHHHHRLGSRLEEETARKDLAARGTRRELVETNVVEGAKTVLRGEAGGPGMAYPAPAAALNRHSPFSSSPSSVASIATTGPGNPNGHLTVTGAHLPAPAAPRPTDFSVSSLLTAASTHPPLLGRSSSQGSISPPPGGPGSPAAAPETPPPPLPTQRELSHNSSAVAAASYFGALAAAGFYNPSAHLPPVSSPSAHHLQSKAILAGAHHHPQFNPQALGHPGKLFRGDYNRSSDGSYV